MGAYTGSAVAAMKGGKPGDSFTREEMSKIVGRDCGLSGSGYGNVLTAINHCVSNYGVYWQWVRSAKKWICQDDQGKSGAVRAGVCAARRRVRRAARLGSTIDREKLNDAQSRELNLFMASASMMDICSSSGFRKKLENTEKPILQPDIAKISELMIA